MDLKLQSVSKVVNGETYLRNIDLVFETGSRNVLLGRTLAGKTTLLRLMAGLDRPTSGKIIVDGQDVTNVSVRKRSVAMVYQQFINYPSMTVYNNIASPLKLAKLDRVEIDRKVRQTAEMLHIEGFLDRLPSELSGGQQQRTAIAAASGRTPGQSGLQIARRAENRVAGDLRAAGIHCGVHHHRTGRGPHAGGPYRGAG